MLHTLRIRNLVVVEDLSVDFGPGFNVLTGETGAGKSIVVDALGLAAGERAETGLVRHGADRALVEAVFEVDPRSPAAQTLEARGIPVDEGAIIVRRELSATAAGRVFVNDSPVTLAAVREACDGLVELLGQHASRTLTSRSAHGEMLDAFGGHEAEAAAVQKSYDDVRRARQRLAELDDLRSSRERRVQELRSRVAEIDAGGLRVGDRKSVV